MAAVFFRSVMAVQKGRRIHGYIASSKRVISTHCCRSSVSASRSRRYLLLQYCDWRWRLTIGVAEYDQQDRAVHRVFKYCRWKARSIRENRRGDVGGNSQRAGGTRLRLVRERRSPTL